MKISFIIVSWNTCEKTCACVASLRKYMPEHELIVVDNNSADDSCEQLKERFPDVKLIENNDNRGFGTANNQGAEIATGDVYCFINSDAELPDESLGRLAGLLLQNPSIGATGPRVIRGDGTFEYSYGRFPTYGACLVRFGFEFFLPFKTLFDAREKYWRRRFRSALQVDWVSGCCLLMHAGLFKEMGGWDERYFAYFEDVELCRRVSHAGNKVVYDPQATIIHHHKASFSQSSWMFRFKTSFQSAALFLEGAGYSLSRFLCRVAWCWWLLLAASAPVGFLRRVREKRTLLRELILEARRASL